MNDWNDFDVEELILALLIAVGVAIQIFAILSLAL